MTPTPKPSAGPARAAADMPRHFRTPLARRLLALFGVVTLALVSVVMIGFAAASFTLGWAVGVLLLAIAGFMMALTAYVWRDFRGNWGLRVDLDDHAVRLDLPAWRSLIHRPPARHLSVPYTDIAAIDTRLEAYSSLGMAMMQRSYALQRKSGELIFLFEERALGTPFESSQFNDIVTGLIGLAGVELHDLGMVEGRGGFLAAWATHAPEWTAPSLPPERQQQLWGRARATGSAAIVTTMAVTSAWYGGLLTQFRRGARSKPPSSAT